MTRTSTLRAADSPTRRTSPSCSTRSSRSWVVGVISPTSSSKIVPPCASSKRPRRSAMAPVKAPRTWPKSSDSSKVSDRAPQFWATNFRVPAAAALVDQPGEQLLAGARLAAQQDGGRRVEHLAGQADGLAQAGGGAGHAIERGGSRANVGDLSPDGVVGELQLLAQPSVLLGERVALGRTPQDDEQLVGIPRLGHEVIDVAGVDGIHEAVDVGVGGEDQPDGVRRDGLALAEHLDAGHPGHLVVGQHHRDVLGPQQLEGRAGRCRREGRETRRPARPRARPARAARRRRSEDGRLVGHGSRARISYSAARCLMPFSRGVPSSR